MEKTADVDRLLIFDDALLVVEAKAGKFTPEARRGAPKRLASDLGDLLDKAFGQGKRLLDILRTRGEVRLFDKHDNEVLRLDPTKFRFEFIITVTFDLLSILQCNVSAVRQLGLIQGSEWPWSVYINDLRVIAEMTDHPTTFIHYLLRRLPANDAKELDIRDELDLFGVYRSGHLFFPKGRKPKADGITFFGFTDDFDAYYNGLAGHGPLKEKPKHRMFKRVEQLLTTLEQQRPRHFVTACVDLLDMDGKTAQSTNDALEHIQERYATRDRAQCLIVMFHHDDHFLVIGCSKAGVCPPLHGFPQFVRALRKRRPSRITAVFFEPPLGVGRVTVRHFEKPPQLAGAAEAVG